tara:strand:- start:21777 stop:22037 length:261 start_codon:yes stop_codon:yes gene_type:complete
MFSEPAAPGDRKRFRQQHERYSAKAMSVFAVFGAPTIIAPTISRLAISKPAKALPAHRVQLQRLLAIFAAEYREFTTARFTFFAKH